MKFKEYKNKNLPNINLIDFDLINEQFLNKIIDEKLEPNIYNIYADLELLKKDKSNSFIFNIIQNYLKINDFEWRVQNVMFVATNFFNKIYGDVVKKYKEDLKKEFEIENQKIKNYVYLSFEDEVVKMPKRIGHNYIPIKILPMEEIHTKYSRHKRIKTFHSKGLNCVNCSRVGKYLIAAKDNSGQIHLDIYTEDFHLMTVDHIKPKSLGGTYNIENLDPMCSECNGEKSNKYEEI